MYLGTGLFLSAEEEWKEIGRGFYEQWNFPNYVGAIDGKHVPIVPPPGSASFFFNYQKFHSQVLLGVADYDYKLIYFSFGVNGRVSDGDVLSYCDLYEKMAKKTLGLPQPSVADGTLLPYVFIGDEEFELRENLMKPFNASVLNYERRICNYRFSRARRIIENVYGILVARFGVLQKPITLRIDRISDVVLACFALHNFLRATSPNKYTPSDCLDEESEEVLIPGLRIDYAVVGNCKEIEKERKRQMERKRGMHL
ncbi:uncharacterized protein LOC124363592 [Homalodisca vitripennis]|uniref:uncharacterized protein LOC124363592 n=1 Tax=Homalodisca vitripennis TaxID=197043 RepID=UPI001EEAC178|nr:uncharacterized protein LOC124363592 [Homalodisca vitripennis]